MCLAAASGEKNPPASPAGKGGKSMKIVTSGKWKGYLIVEGDRKENLNGNANFTYNTIEEEDEVKIILRLRPGETDMKLEVKAQRD